MAANRMLAGCPLVGWWATFGVLLAREGKKFCEMGPNSTRFMTAQTYLETV